MGGRTARPGIRCRLPADLLGKWAMNLMLINVYGAQKGYEAAGHRRFGHTFPSSETCCASPGRLHTPAMIACTSPSAKDAKLDEASRKLIMVEFTLPENSRVTAPPQARRICA